MRTNAADALFDLYHSCGHVHAALTRRADNILPFDLTMAQFNILDDLKRADEPVVVQSFAVAHNITKGAVTNLLHQLEAKQFIKLEKNPADGRSKLVTLTLEGAKAHRHSMVALSELTSELLQDFSEEDLSSSLPLMKRFVAWLDAK
ncbi:MAG: MarR family transcriptional regulator [Nitratireductor sp.]